MVSVEGRGSLNLARVARVRGCAPAWLVSVDAPRDTQELTVDRNKIRREMRKLAGDDLPGKRPGWVSTLLRRSLSCSMD